MKKATKEDRLRQDYFDLLRELIKIQKLMEAKIKWYLKDTTYNLDKKHQQIEIESRVKDCDSAIETLKRRQKQTYRLILFAILQSTVYFVKQFVTLIHVPDAIT